MIGQILETPMRRSTRVKKPVKNCITNAKDQSHEHANTTNSQDNFANVQTEETLECNESHTLTAVRKPHNRKFNQCTMKQAIERCDKKAL